jgi:predicted DNA-binding protein YlxM (UPF0122 family)
MASKPYHDEATLRELYCEQDLGIAEISERFDVSETTIWVWLDRNGIETSTFDPAEERFERQYKVDDESGCWVWTGATEGGGYGTIGVNGGSMGAHRYSYKLHNGEIPEGAFICHKCHNPPCVNPDHLYAGDAKTNAQDAIDNGDWPELYGEEQGHASLTNAEAESLRNEYAAGATVAELSDDYDVSAGSVSRIINGKSYPNAGGPIATDTYERMAKRGEDVENSKFTETDVREIRRTYAEEDVTMAELGDRYDTSSSAICDIVNRNTWQHVE